MKAKGKRQKENIGENAVQKNETAETVAENSENDPVCDNQKNVNNKKGNQGKKKNSRISTIFILIVLIAGLSLLLYPSVSNYWNSFHSSKAIADYANAVSNMNEDEYEKLLEKAHEYNRSLAGRDNLFYLSDSMKEEYNELLNVTGTGVMGYIEIPSINVSLPIYHGTSDSVLQIAIGHLDWSFLPIGGVNTHSVISGHRGLPSAKLFTDLDKLVNGDVFVIRVLNEVFTYEVDQILIVEPDDTSALGVIPDGDFCTLVTCTPYGINSHRLLVRGHRTENLEDSKVIRVTADAVQIEPLIVAPIIAIPILFGLMLILLFKPKKRKKIESPMMSDEN